MDMTDEELRKLVDAGPFDAFGAAELLGALKQEAKSMPENLKHVGNALVDMTEKVVRDKISSDATIRDLAAEVLRLRAQVEAAKGLVEAFWRAPETYPQGADLVQVLCQVTQPETVEFPRACEMPVSSGDHAVGDLFVSIGWRDDDGEWFVAGWEMTQDCWTDARCFVVKGWQPTPAALSAPEAAQ